MIEKDRKKEGKNIYHTYIQIAQLCESLYIHLNETQLQLTFTRKRTLNTKFMDNKHTGIINILTGYQLYFTDTRQFLIKIFLYHSQKSISPFTLYRFILIKLLSSSLDMDQTNALSSFCPSKSGGSTSASACHAAPKP